jgi:hypothetical protein
MNKLQRTIALLLSYIFLATFAGAVIYVIYIATVCTNERTNCEYQFVVIDRNIKVFDGNRVVGTVPIEGQLDSLINADNY